MKKVKDLIRKNPEPSGQATYKNPGFLGQVSATSQIAEGALERYLKSMGIDPRFVSKNTKVSHSKSGHFLKWKKDRQLEDTSSVDVTHPRSRDIQSPTMQRAKAIQKSKSQHQIQPVNSNPTKNPIKSEEVITEVSSSALDRYKEKAKKSADTLSTQGQHKKATDRWLNIMKATGKQMDKTTAGIKKSLSKEDAGISKGTATKFHAKLDKLVHDTFGKRKNEEVEHIDEVSKKTLGSYVKKSEKDIENHAQDAGWRNWNDPVAIKASKKSMSRQAGVKKARERLAKEEVVSEANITHAAHFDDPKTGKWASMALLTAKNDQDAVSQAHDLLRTDAYRHFKLSAVERHEPVKNIKMKEDVEQIDEISKELTHSYFKKAYAQKYKNEPTKPTKLQMRNRNKGMNRAHNRLVNRLELPKDVAKTYANHKPGQYVGDSYDPQGQMLDEVSLGDYKDKATQQSKELKKHSKGEYAGIAKHLLARRQKGLKMATARLDKTLLEPNELKQSGGSAQTPKLTQENTMYDRIETSKINSLTQVKNIKEYIFDSQDLRYANLMDAVSRLKEDMFDHEKEDKSVATYGKKPKFEKADKDDSKGEKKPEAAAVMSGGTTLTGEKRDTIEIDPMMRARPGQPDPTKKKEGEKDGKKEDKKKDK